MTVKISTADAPRYHFEVDGRSYSMPTLEALPLPFLRETVHRAEDGKTDEIGVDFILAIIDRYTVDDATGESAAHLSDVLGAAALMAIFSDYTQGEALGESLGSSD